MKRSRIHMLMVSAARLEQDGGNPKLITDLRAAAKWEAGRFPEGRAHSIDDDKRIGRQRTIMAMVPDTRAKDDLLSAMAQRAYDLMWDGLGTECDAIAEFLPSALVEKMFAAWDNDQDARSPRTDFYAGGFRV